MPAVISEKGQALLEDLPAYYADDPNTQAVMDSLGRELQRVEDAGRAFAAGFIPATATDEYGLLSMWERLLGLPVAPTGISESSRRNIVMAALQQHRAGSGKQWMAVLSRALGTDQWQHEEREPYTLRVTLPSGTDAFTSAQALAIIRRITPANLALELTYGWLLLDISQLDYSSLG